MVLSDGSDFRAPGICSLEELPKEGYWAVLTTAREEEGRLLELHRSMGDRLIVPEVWKELLPDSPILISSAISGGDLRTRFRQAAEEHDCYLLPEPLGMRFPLPCRDGVGETVEVPDTQGFYSETLCCYYAHEPGSVILWDTEETMMQKTLLAKELGFLGCVETKNSAVK